MMNFRFLPSLDALNVGNRHVSKFIRWRTWLPEQIKATKHHFSSCAAFRVRVRVCRRVKRIPSDNAQLPFFKH